MDKRDQHDEGVRKGLAKEAPDGSLGWSMGDAMRKLFTRKLPGPPGPFPWSALLFILAGVGLFLGYKYGLETSHIPNSSRPQFYAIVFGIAAVLLFGLVRQLVLTLVLIGLVAFILPITLGITLPDLLRYYF